MPERPSPLLATGEPTAVEPVEAEPVEIEHPAAAEPAEAGHVPAAVGTAQNRASEGDVESPELGRQLVLLGQDPLAVGEAPIGLCLHRTETHLVARDVGLLGLVEGAGAELRHVELRRGDILDDAIGGGDRPTGGDEAGGEGGTLHQEL